MKRRNKIKQKHKAHFTLCFVVVVVVVIFRNFQYDFNMADAFVEVCQHLGRIAIPLIKEDDPLACQMIYSIESPYSFLSTIWSRLETTSW